MCFAGAEKVFDLGELSDFEQAGLKDLIPELKSSIEKGFEFGRSG
jgi:malate dehydrogenase